MKRYRQVSRRPLLRTSGPTAATVNWTTNELSTSRVDYGTTTAFGQSTTLSPALVLQHSQQILGLAANTTYQFQVVSTDWAGNTSTSGPFSFTTTPPRTTPPVFTNIRITDLQPDQVVIGWTTDEVADSRIEYGLTSAYGTVTPNDPTLTTSHFVLITNLAPSIVYHYRVQGTDPYGNTGASADISFQTPAIPPPITTDATAFVDGRGPVTTPAFNTTTPGDLLVAFVGSDGPAVGQRVAVSGAGLTWTLDRFTNAQSGTSEIWHAVATNLLSKATVTSTQGTGSYDQSLTVVAFKGASGVGSTAGTNAPNGAPSATLSMIGARSLVYTVGNDYDNTIARTVAPGQSMIHQWVDTTTGDTFWTQALNGDAGAVESDITLADTAPTADRWNFTAAEIIRPISVPPPPPTPRHQRVAAYRTIRSTSATITWTTDQLATSRVLFGPNASYSDATTTDLAGVTTHSQTITGLTPGATYHYAAVSANGVGSTTSGDFMFSTTSNAPVDQTISFGALGNATLAQSPVLVSASASSGLAVTFSTTTPAVCSSGGVNGASISLLTTGTCTVKADQAGNGSFNAAPSVSQGFLVSKANQTISFGALGNVGLAQSPVLVGASASSGLAVTFTTTTPAVCSSGGVNGASISLLTTGTCTVQADQAGNGTYNAAAPVQQSFTVLAAVTGVSIDKSVFVDGRGAVTTAPFSTTVAGDVLVAFVGADGSLSGQTVSVSGAGLSWSLVRRTNTTGGTAEIWTAIAPSALSNVTVTSTLGSGVFDQSLTVVAFKGASGVGVNASASGTSGAPSVGLTTTKAGSWVFAVGNDYSRAVARSVPGTQTMVHQWVDTGIGDTYWVQSTNAPTANAGTPVTINDTAPTNDRWNLTAVEVQSAAGSGAPVDQTISFGALGNATLAQSPVLVSASASSGLAVTFSTTTPAVCSSGGVNGASISLLTTGTCTVKADQAGNGSFNAAPSVSQGFLVSKANQTISFGALGNVGLAQSPVLVGASASSGLAVTFTTTTPAVCSSGGVNGASISLLTTGTCTVQADQAGNGTYNAAAPVQQSFTVLAAVTGVSIDKSVFVDGRGAVTTAPFSTTVAGDVLVAFVGADGSLSGQTVSVSGAGLSWSLVRRTNTTGGTAEIWTAIAPSALSNVTVTSTLGSGVFDQSLTVVAFKGASGVGVNASASGTSGAPSVGLTTTKAGSWVFAVGNDYSRAVARSVPGTQTMVHQWVDTGIGDTYWVQSTNAPTATAGTPVTINDTAPTNDRWNLTAVEIKSA